MTAVYPEMERVLVVNAAQLHSTLSKLKVIVMWYDLYNFKKVLLVLLLVKLQAFLTLLHGYFSRFLNCTNGTKLRKTSHMVPWLTLASHLWRRSRRNGLHQITYERVLLVSKILFNLIQFYVKKYYQTVPKPGILFKRWLGDVNVRKYRIFTLI